MAPCDGPLVEPALGSGFTRGLAQPVQRQADGQYGEEDERPHQGPVQAGPFHGVVLEVRAPVGSKLDLRARLGRAVGRREDVDEPRPDGHDRNGQADLLLGGDSEQVRHSPLPPTQ